MVASSALRMILYIRYYYFTFYRLLVLWALIVISALMCGILINIWNHNFNIVKYSLITFFSLYLVLSFSHLDFFVAHFNLKNNQVTENTFFLSEDAYHDMEYVNSLSYDAAPAVYAAHIDGPAFYEKMVYRAGREEMSPRQFNVSVYIAKKLAKE